MSRCPSFALHNNVITGPFRRKDDLQRLKARFATEVRRNLFEAYLRPRETLINLICYTANSSTAFPGGEAFRFTFSPNGQTLLALSSSRIYVIDLTADPPLVRRELKTVRRPIAASVTDDGSLLAVLSTRHQANVYGLTPDGVKHIQVLVLDNPPRTIALAHEGTVLAAAYDGGVEVFSLAANALSTDRRAVRCEAVDSLTFSGDGSMLVGSSHGQEDPSAVIITAPFYTENDPNLSNRDVHSRMWTTQILFPNNSSTCSHAALLPSHQEGDGNWLFAFDHTLQSYRAVRTDDTRTGVAYFLSPPVSRRFSMPSPTTAPTASATGDLAVAGFSGTGLWVYGIPEKVDTAPDMGAVVEREEQHSRGSMALTSATGHREPLMAYSPSMSGSTESIDEEEGLAGRVDWRQSIFVKPRHLKSIPGLTAAQWVEKSEAVAAGFPGKRLAIVAPGGVSSFAEEMGDEAMPVDGGRISILDFDYAPQEGGNRVFTIEVGEKEADLLPEQHGNLDVEVALERRRTVRATRGRGSRRLSLGRSATAIGAHSVDYSTSLDERLARNSLSQPPSPDDDKKRGMESPDSHSQSPSRSLDRLQRAATAAAVTRARYPPRPPLGSQQQGIAEGHVMWNRQNGVRQLPHESDADSWEPPPPPYKHSPPAHLPVDFYAAAVLPRHATEPVERVTEQVSPPHRASTTLDGMMTSETGPSRRFMSQYGGLSNRIFRPRGMSESSLDAVSETTMTPQFSAHARPLQRQVTGDSIISPLTMGSSPSSLRRRPVSFDGRARSDSYFSLRATISRPLSSSPHVDLSPQELGTRLVNRNRPATSPVSPADGNENSGNVSLTGANLQNRLNQPVPPPPSQTDQEMASQYIPPKLQAGRPPPPPALINQNQNRNAEPFITAPPTAGQMANLNRRVSGERRKPLPISTPPTGPGFYDSNQGRPTSRSAVQDFAVPPSPPRAAWGAAGVPGSLPFNKASRNPPQQVSRSGSSGSLRSFGLSVSTPSLLTPQRPRYGRLDTIESIASNEDHHGRSRSHSVVQGMDRRMTNGMGTSHEGVGPVMYDQRMLAPTRNTKTDKKWRKKWKGLDRESSDVSQENAAKTKGLKCVVM